MKQKVHQVWLTIESNRNNRFVSLRNKYIYLFYFPILHSPSCWNSRYFQYWREKYYVGKWLQDSPTVKGWTCIYWIPHELGKFNGFIFSSKYSPSCSHQKCVLNLRRETICRKVSFVHNHTVGRGEQLHWTLGISFMFSSMNVQRSNNNQVPYWKVLAM